MTTHRYAVVGVWGTVPDQVREIVGKPEAFLIYPEFRGQESMQGFMNCSAVVGGWHMTYAGVRPQETE